MSDTQTNVNYLSVGNVPAKVVTAVDVMAVRIPFGKVAYIILALEKVVLIAGRVVNVELCMKIVVDPKNI